MAQGLLAMALMLVVAAVAAVVVDMEEKLLM